MEIEYELTEADILALINFRLRRSQGSRNPILVRRITYFVGFAIMALGSWLLMKDLVLPIIFLILAIIAIVFYPLFFNWLIQRKVTLTYRDPKKRTSLAPRILRIVNDGLLEISDLGETKVKWDVINEITITPKHAFLFVQNDPSIIVPKDRLSSENFQGFVDLCRKNIQKRAA